MLEQPECCLPKPHIMFCQRRFPCWLVNTASSALPARTALLPALTDGCPYALLALLADSPMLTDAAPSTLTALHDTPLSLCVCDLCPAASEA